MQPFLYRFGYSTPEQWRQNDKHGWDDESSAALWILADSSERALEWGDAVAEKFTEDLFAKDGGFQVVPSWKSAGFASWIEENPAGDFSDSDLAKIPTVKLGVHPRFSDI